MNLKQNPIRGEAERGVEVNLKSVLFFLIILFVITLLALMERLRERKSKKNLNLVSV
jgi:preprotein translocase subunit SecG